MKYFSILTISFLTVFLLLTQEAKAVLGNTIEENALIFKSKPIVDHSNYCHGKEVYRYQLQDKEITIIYKENISISEQITYKKATNQTEATNDMKEYILPNAVKIPLYKSFVNFSNGHYKEELYTQGIKTKTIINECGLVTGIISSAMFDKGVKKSYE